MTRSRWLALFAVAFAVATFFYFDLDALLTLENLKAEQASLEAQIAEQPALFVTGFFVIYVLATAVSLPGAATALTLVAGALLGLVWGVVFVSFASTIGATLAMILARWLFKEEIERRFASQLATINRGIEKDGAFYLFTLRLVPIFPFWAINILMALTRMSVLQFYLVSQLGMFAGTLVYVNAGTELARIEQASDVLSPGLIASFVLLGVFPLLAKWLVDFLRARRVYSNYERPRRFDTDMVVIGAGSGGLVAALIAATVKARVTLIEKNKMGGDCLNTGCVPSKALIRSARHAYDNRRGSELGFDNIELPVDLNKVMRRVQRAIAKIEPHDSVERYESLGVDVELGEGRIVSPWQVEVNGKFITTRNIVIATGAEPFVPPIAGIEMVDYLTSDNIWSLEQLPGRTIVLGGGPIGTELTQALARLGSQVTQVELLPNILPREDIEFSTLVREQLEAEGVSVMNGYKATEVGSDDGENYLVVTDEAGIEQRVLFDQLVVAVGRKANTTGFGLEEIGVELNANGTVAVDDYLRTNFPNIFAIGDVAGPYQFTHTASHMAWYAAVNALFGVFRKFRVDYSVIPWATFCAPEIARVGMNEQEAKAAGIDYEVTTYDVSDLDRAIADEAAHGLVKVLTRAGSDKVIGATIAAEHAGELIGEFTLAMKHGIGLKKIMGTIHIYPTFLEMNKFAASEWRKAHKPEWALAVAERFHTWRRG
ncbi:MAG: FAD-dependent oxidoreductase [Gammaproteobacteria bacterium]